MKNLNIKKLCAAAFIVLSLTFSGSAQENGKKELRIIGESFPPFEFIRNGKVVGIDVDIINEIAEKLNIKVNFRIYPWKRCWLLVTRGRAEAVLSTSINKSRLQYLWYPKEYMWKSNYIFFTTVKKKQTDTLTLDDAVAGNLTIGITRGNSYHPRFWRKLPYKDGSTDFLGDFEDEKLNENLVACATLEDCFINLGNNRFDLTICDNKMGIYTCRMLNISDKITHYSNTIFEKPFFMPFIKNSKYENLKEIADAFDRELGRFKKSPRYREIMDKWLLKD